jgi:hypothetical protein
MDWSFREFQWEVEVAVLSITQLLKKWSLKMLGSSSTGIFIFCFRIYTKYSPVLINHNQARYTDARFGKVSLHHILMLHLNQLGSEEMSSYTTFHMLSTYEIISLASTLVSWSSRGHSMLPLNMTRFSRFIYMRSSVLKATCICQSWCCGSFD